MTERASDADAEGNVELAKMIAVAVVVYIALTLLTRMLGVQ